MSRLLVHVEGQTEETFVNDALAPHLYRVGYTSVSARLIGNARQRSRRGGIRSWESVRKDILNHLREDPAALATTMVDYYGLPRTWPGREHAGRHATLKKRAATVEQAILEDLSKGTGRPPRFVPYVVMHEFEGLLFSDPDDSRGASASPISHPSSRPSAGVSRPPKTSTTRPKPRRPSGSWSCTGAIRNR